MTELEGKDVGWVYIMASRPNGTLYVGVTNNLARRAHEHRESSGGAFTRKYGVTKLVWCEEWTRAMKLKLIEHGNPTWQDLYETLNW